MFFILGIVMTLYRRREVFDSFRQKFINRQNTDRGDQHDANTRQTDSKTTTVSYHTDRSKI